MKRTTPNQANWREQIDFFPYTWREECEKHASHWVRIHNLVPEHGACYSGIIGSPTPRPVENQNEYKGDMLKLLKAANRMFDIETVEQCKLAVARENASFQKMKAEAKKSGDDFKKLQLERKKAQHRREALKRKHTRDGKFDRDAYMADRRELIITENRVQRLNRERDERRQARIDKLNAMTTREREAFELKKAEDKKKRKEREAERARQRAEDRAKFNRLACDQYLRRKKAWLIRQQRKHMPYNFYTNNGAEQQQYPNIERTYNMSLIAKEDGEKRAKTMVPEGTHIARCYAVVDLGTHDDTYKGVDRKRRKVILSFEFPNQLHVFKEEDGEQPLGRSKTFTNSLSEKATLRKMLQSWRGRAFTQKELQGFDLSTVSGHPVQVGVIHYVKDNGEKTDVIDSLIACPQGLNVPDAINEPYSYSIDEHPKNWDRLSKWMQEEVMQSDEFKALGAEPEAPVEVTDEVPF